VNALAESLSPLDPISGPEPAGNVPGGPGARWWRVLNGPGDPHSYWLTRFVLLRWLGLVYGVAFLVAANQIVPLIGADGLLPVGQFLDRVQAICGSRAAGFLQLPSLFWLRHSDAFLVAAAWVGVALSVVVMLGYADAILMTILWALYLSFVHVGQDWYSYGWEIQLLETGFLAIFLCPLLDGRPFPRRPPPTPVLWLFRWLGFRIMVGAGLIKLRGDPCWRNLTCLYYHYETQPVPNPLSRYLFFLPHWFQKLSVLWNHFIELIVPWFMFAPRRARHLAGVLLVSFQFILILSGNLSFLNWLTIVPMLACFDDSFWRRILPRRLTACATRAAAEARPSRGHQIAVALLVLIVVVLSFFPVLNMLSPHQAMNTSFDRLHLVNTYGAFGTVGRVRREIVFEGTSDPVINAQTKWKEYEFPAKPGNPMRRPCIITPYHYRLDWQMWFAAMATPEQYPWTLNFVWKLLHNDSQTLSLLANNPFPKQPPRYIRAVLYRYRFAPPGNPSGAWWVRRRVGSWLPPLSVDDPAFRRFLADYGWLPAAGKPPGTRRE
jgi:Lipase maturation factor